MAPFTLEGRVLSSYAVPDAPVRECPICPPWVECAHFEGQVIRLVTRETMKRWPNRCYAGEADDVSRAVPIVNGPGVFDREAGFPPSCSCWTGYEGVILPGNRRSFPTEAEARAEFERRVALMLEAE